MSDKATKKRRTFSNANLLRAVNTVAMDFQLTPENTIENLVDAIKDSIVADAMKK